MLGVKKASRRKPTQRLNQSLLYIIISKTKDFSTYIKFCNFSKIRNTLLHVLTSNGGAGDGRRYSINRQLNSTESIRTLNLGLSRNLCA